MKKLLIAVTACATFALVGCGGDDDGGSKELTKDEFIAQADDICEASNDEVDKAEDSFANPDSPTEEEIDAAMSDVVVPQLQAQHDDIADLNAPEDDQEQIDEMLESLQAGIDSLEEDWQNPDNEAFANANKIANDYGFEECGEDE